jgi:hypothetical protein
LARAKHNDLREGHQWVDAISGAVTITPPLQGDDENAKKIQSLMKTKFTGTEDSIKAYVPLGCSMNIYTEMDEDKVADLERSHAATDAWYHNGIGSYDYAAG